MFHDACLKLVLQNSDKCPLCRNLCYIEDKLLTIHKEEEEEEEESNCEVDGHVAGEGRHISEGEVHGQAAVASSAGGGKSNNVRQARTFLGLFSLVCMILSPFRNIRCFSFVK
jgi:hypothetical protein